MTCDRSMQVHAYVDGELDAPAAAELERHMETCGECAQLRADLEATRKDIRERASYYRAEDRLAKSVHHMLDRENKTTTAKPTRRPFWLGAFGGAAATALAASLIVAVMLPSTQDVIASDMVSAHLRSLMGTHLIDVESSNHHVVKPWFAGRVDISPFVEDFAKQGFTLVGGRVDYVHGERAAVLVYRHGAHVVNVFAWKDDGSARTGRRTVNGYNLVCWKNGGIFYCAVSDTAQDELDQLSKLMQENRTG